MSGFLFLLAGTPSFCTPLCSSTHAAAAVRARLADSRAILVASREAMRMVGVPPGVLAGVLAEARRADDELLELSAADEAPAQADSWWSRVRKSFFIPSLAVVGTAV